MSDFRIAALDFQFGSPRVTSAGLPASGSFSGLVPVTDCVIAIFNEETAESVASALVERTDDLIHAGSGGAVTFGQSGADSGVLWRHSPLEPDSGRLQADVQTPALSIPQPQAALVFEARGESLSEEPDLCTTGPCIFAVGRLPEPEERLREGVDSLVRVVRAFLPRAAARPAAETRVDEPAPPEYAVTANSAPAGGPDSDGDRLRQRIFDTGRWLTATDVYRNNPTLGGIPNAVHAHRLRTQGRLLGVWDGRRYLYPEFQFEPRIGSVSDSMAELLNILPADNTGWKQAIWLFQPRRELDGKSAAEVFRQNPDTILDIARKRFGGDDAHW